MFLTSPSLFDFLSIIVIKYLHQNRFSKGENEPVMNEKLKNIVYLDNAATTKTHDDVAELAYKMMTECYANPSSAHSFGFEAEGHIKVARERIIKALGYKTTDGALIFTSGGTEADNMAIVGGAKTLCRKGKHIVITDSEHPAVENTVATLEKNGYTVSRIPTKNGELDLDFAEKVLSSDTVVVSCMTINNETGAIYDIASLRKIVAKKSPNAYFHTDGVQAFTKIKSFCPFGVDMISISGHKIHAPKGVGALWIKKGVRIPPYITGGGQEGGLRSGTEAVPAICAFGLAAEKAMKAFEEDKTHIEALNTYLRDKIKDIDGVLVNTHIKSHDPHIISIAVKGIRSEIMLRFLADRGICVSAGSACSSKSSDNRILAAYGLDKSIADSTLRVSFSSYNTLDDIDKFVINLNEGINSLIKVK